MSALLASLAQVLHLLLLLAAAPLAAGLARRIAARLEGRAGPPLLQPWHELRRRWHQAPVRAEGATWLSRHAPAVQLAALLAAAALLPGFTTATLLAPFGDLVAIAGLLALARIAAALATLDAGTATGAATATTAVARDVLAMPALLLVVFVLAQATGTTTAAAMAAAVAEGAAGLALVPLALATLLLAWADADAAVDDAEAAGRRLALDEAAGALRHLVWMALLAGLFLPWGTARAPSVLGWGIGLLAWSGKIALLALLAALARALLPAAVPRPRDRRLAVAATLALLSLLLLATGQRAGLAMAP